MKLRFFTDHCIPSYIINGLRKAKCEVFVLGDYMPVSSVDLKVILKAQELDSILVSLNGDFADIVAYPPEKYKGIVSLQIKNHPQIIPQVMENFLNYISKYPDMSHFMGKLFIVEAHRIRIRK